MTEQKGKADLDADVLAIRELLKDQTDGTEPAPDERPGTKPAVKEAAEAAVSPAKPLGDEPAEAPNDELDAAIRGMVDATDNDTSLKNQIRAAEKAADAVVTPRRRRLPAPLARLVARVRGYRPTRRHIALAVLALLAVFRPWLLVALLLLPVIVVAGLFMSFGHDRFWAGVLKYFNWYRAKHPDRAERLRRKADGFALRWDAVLDRFPEGTVDALYLPDLNSLQEREDRHKKALAARFDKLQDEAKAQ